MRERDGQGVIELRRDRRVGGRGEGRRGEKGWADLY